MILNIKSYLLKIDIYSILVLLIFLAAPLRFYVSTSIILEIVTFGLVVWGFAKHKFTKKIWSPTASKFVVYFFIYFIISSFISYNGFDEAGFANENYRFFLFLIMLAVIIKTLSLVLQDAYIIHLIRIYLYKFVGFR